jgi:hypothetical protein
VDVALDAGALRPSLDHAANVAPVELVARERGEEARTGRPARAPLDEERLERGVDRDDAILVALAADMQEIALQINVAGPQSGRLRARSRIPVG